MMSSGGTLRRSFLQVLSGNVVYAASQWALVIILAKLGTPAQLGEYALGMAIVTPIFLLFGMNLRAAQATDANGRFGFSEYVAVRLYSSLVALCVSAAVALPLVGNVAGFVVVGLCAVLKFVDSLHDVIYGHLQQKEEMRAISRSMMFRGITALAVTAAAMGVFASVVLALSGTIVCWAGVLLFHDARGLRVLQSLRAGLRVHRLGKLSRGTLALGIIATLDSLNVQIPKYVVQFVEGEAAVGRFTALVTLIMVGGIVLSALGNASLPRLAILWERGDLAGFISLQRRLLVLGATVGGVGVLVGHMVGQPFLLLAYNRDVASELLAFQLLMYVAAVWYVVTILGFSLNAIRAFQEQLRVFIWMDVATCVASFALIPMHGVLGASLAFGAGVVVRLATSIVVFRGLINRQRLVLQP